MIFLRTVKENILTATVKTSTQQWIVCTRTFFFFFLNKAPKHFEFTTAWHKWVPINVKYINLISVHEHQFESNSKNNMQLIGHQLKKIKIKIKNRKNKHEGTQ